MIINKVYKGTTPFVKGYKGTTVIFEEGGSLPSEYQQVEYIESTVNYPKDSNYIDTGIYPSATINTWIYFEFTNNFDDWGRLFGSRYYEILFYGNINNIQFRPYSGVTYDYRQFEYNTRYTLSMGDGKININDNLEYEYTYSGNDNYTIRLFSSQQDRDGAYKLYACKMYDGDALIRDYVPCYIKATNEVGLYDLVTKEFYHNLGSVPFIAGGNV